MNRIEVFVKVSSALVTIILAMSKLMGEINEFYRLKESSSEKNNKLND